MTDDVPPADVTEAFQHRFGSDLRGVMFYSGEGDVDVRYLRDDVGQALTEAIQEDQVQELLMDLHVAEIQERKFSLGDYSGSARFFDEATVLNFVFDTDVGMVVSLDPDSEVVDRDLLNWCRGTVETTD